MEDTKNFQKKSISFPGSGKWIEKPRRSTVLVCSLCKGKYIKTRAQQNKCVRCMFRDARTK